MNATTTTDSRHRKIVYRTAGRAQGPVARLISPGDLGQTLKPFVFLDLFEGGADMAADFGLHPHSGIATITVLTEGDLVFAGPAEGCGRFDYGAVEWMRAGNGVWHGNEMKRGVSDRVRGFQLWIALRPETENAPIDAQYLEAAAIPQIGPAKLILGQYQEAQSPVRAPDGVNYLLVTLRDGECWHYAPPACHAVAWACVSKGALLADGVISTGELAVFAPGEDVIKVTARHDTCFVLGSAVPHTHALVMGYHSVHTSGEALRKGEANIEAIRPR